MLPTSKHSDTMRLSIFFIAIGDVFINMNISTGECGSGQEGGNEEAFGGHDGYPR